MYITCLDPKPELILFKSFKPPDGDYRIFKENAQGIHFHSNGGISNKLPCI